MRRLFPERSLADPPFDFVTAPRAIDQQIQPALFHFYTLEQGFDVGVNSVIAARGHANAATRSYGFSGLVNCAGHIVSCRLTFHAAACDINRGATFTQIFDTLPAPRGTNPEARPPVPPRNLPKRSRCAPTRQADPFRERISRS